MLESFGELNLSPLEILLRSCQVRLLSVAVGRRVGSDEACDQTEEKEYRKESELLGQSVWGGGRMKQMMQQLQLHVVITSQKLRLCTALLEHSLPVDEHMIRIKS